MSIDLAHSSSSSVAVVAAALRCRLLSNRDATHTELYDIAADPLEKQDLTQWRPKVTRQLLQQIETWKATLPKQPTGNVFSKERKSLPLKK